MKINISKQIGTVPKCTLLLRDLHMLLGNHPQVADNSQKHVWMSSGREEALIPAFWCSWFGDKATTLLWSLLRPGGNAEARQLPALAGPGARFRLSTRCMAARLPRSHWGLQTCEFPTFHILVTSPWKASHWAFCKEERPGRSLPC